MSALQEERVHKRTLIVGASHVSVKTKKCAGSNVKVLERAMKVPAGSKAAAMPAEHGLGLDYRDRIQDGGKGSVE